MASGVFPSVVVNDRHSLERRRLTLAHELAHRVIEAASSASAIGALAEDLISLIKAAELLRGPIAEVEGYAALTRPTDTPQHVGTLSVC